MGAVSSSAQKEGLYIPSIFFVPSPATCRWAVWGVGDVWSGGGECGVGGVECGEWPS